LRMMSELLRRLEEVDHPPVWAFTSLHCLILTDGDTCRRWLASVQVIKQVPQVGESFFEVRYPLPEPWSHATAYTEDTHQAVRLVIAALGLAQPKERSQHL
jgi:hypothetical protein